MININSDFNKLIKYKNNDFSLKKKRLIQSFYIKFFTKQIVSLKKKKLRSIYFKLFKEFESISAYVPKIYKTNLKYMNKKKKLKTRCFIGVKIIIKEKTFQFFDNFFVKYMYFYLKKFVYFKKTKMYLQEKIFNNFNYKVKINKKLMGINLKVLRDFFDFGKIFYKKGEIENIREKIDFIKNRRYKLINLKFFLNTSFIVYFYKLIFIFIINNYKLNLFLCKQNLN